MVPKTACNILQVDLPESRAKIIIPSKLKERLYIIIIILIILIYSYIFINNHIYNHIYIFIIIPTSKSPAMRGAARAVRMNLDDLRATHLQVLAGPHGAGTAGTAGTALGRARRARPHRRGLKGGGKAIESHA